MHDCGIVPAEETRDPERYRLRGIGAGPFRVEEAVEGERVRLTAQSRLLHPEQPQPRRADVPPRPAQFPRSRRRLPARRARCRARRFRRRWSASCATIRVTRAYLLTTMQLHTSYLGWDNSSAPFDRVEVRQAMNYAINRQRLNERIYAGLSVVADGLLPPGLLGYDANQRGYSHDPEQRARSAAARPATAPASASNTAPGTRTSSTTPAWCR